MIPSIYKHIPIAFIYLFCFHNCSAQNVSINVLTHNMGIVKNGSSVLLEITINNTSESDFVPHYKLKPQISFPNAIVSITDKGHQLPEGWSIIYNKDGVVRLSNGTDRMPPNSARTIMLLIKGKKVGKSSAISANLLFANGVEPGTVSGTATMNDNPADNTSTSTIEVTN